MSLTPLLPHPPSPLPHPRRDADDLFGHKKHWAHRFCVAPFLPISRAEMETLGWDSCDVVLVTGDAYRITSSGWH